MLLKDFMVEKAVRLDLQARDKRGAIREMVEALRDAGSISPDHVDGLVRALMRREQIGSTGIGKGVAVPHARHSSVEKLVGTVARSKDGVEFAALDGQPVHLLFLVVSPQDSAGPHVEALEHIFTILKDDDFCRFVMQVNKPKELMDLLTETEEKLS